jgi:hypothetical protein
LEITKVSIGRRQLNIRILPLVAAILMSAVGSADVIYNNAVPAGLTGEGLITGPRPAGGFYSEVQLGNTIAGFTANGTGFRLGDDFNITAVPVELQSMTLYTYQSSATTPTILNATVEIRTGSVMGPVVATGTFGVASPHFSTSSQC